jgi:exopolysaccharide biosynthesis protein
LARSPLSAKASRTVVNLVKFRHLEAPIELNHIFLVEVDGRQMGLSVGMSFPGLADYMVRLGCEEAMNFDGGGSATLWALGMVRNNPSEGQERPSANALVVLRKRNSAREK